MPLIHVAYKDEKFSGQFGANALVAEILSQACAHFKLDAAQYKLTRKDKDLDTASSLRFLHLTPGVTLTLAERPRLAPNAQRVRVVVHAPSEGDLSGTFPASENLWNILRNFEQNNGLNLTDRHGVPPVESNQYFSVHINRPGYMQPVISYLNHRVENNDKLRQTTLSSLGADSGSVAFRLEWKYVAPAISEEESQKVLQTFKTNFDSAVDQLALSAAAERPDTKMATVSEEEEGDNAQQQHNTLAHTSSASRQTHAVAHGESSVSVAPRETEPIPADRHRMLFDARASSFKHSSEELPDGFHQLTEAEFRAYSASIRHSHELHIHGFHASQLASSKLASHYQRATIRVRLPDRFVLQGTFSATERIKDVQDFVRKCLPGLSDFFTLFTTPPMHVLSEESELAELKFVPAATIHLGVKESAQWKTEAVVDRDLFQKATPLVAERTSTKSEEAAAP